MSVLVVLAALSGGLPSEAEVAREKYFDSVKAARDAYAEDLTKVLGELTKAAELDKANEVKSEIDRVARVAVEPRELAGRWRVYFGKDDFRDYRIDGRNVVWNLGGKDLRMRIQAVDGELIVRFPKAYQRFTLVGDRLFVEHFAIERNLAVPENVGVAYRQNK